MSNVEQEQRPAKKRRFFLDEPEPATPTTNSVPPEPVSRDEIKPEQPESLESPGNAQPQVSPSFDVELLKTVIGEDLDGDVVNKLRQQASDNVEQAINLYLDGSWKTTHNTTPPPNPLALSNPFHEQKSPTQTTPPTLSNGASSPPQLESSGSLRNGRTSMPEKRYVGAFGVVGWATRSGSNLIKHGENLRIERTKKQATTKAGRGGKSKSIAAGKHQDTIVRFTNTRDEEVGRLETESAAWIAPLMDQRLCEFEGHCVFCPDRIRSNDTIYLQLKAFFIAKCFDSKRQIKPTESNRSAGVFEAKETQEERNLHLRQMALVKLFEEINLLPSKTNTATEIHKRQGLLRATEVAERHNEKDESKPQEENGGSSPPSEDAEEGEELQQDQLDSLYKKAQTFDFNTPALEPASSFAMDLRKYQKQALHWMVGKERDEKAENREASMHPLWEEYCWPIKDVDDNDLAAIEGYDYFYVNPYSGELSLDFPVQEQNCLGGILADEMGLGKTIEMLSLMHSQRSEVAQHVKSEESTSVNQLPRLSKNASNVEPAPCTTLVAAPMSLLAQWQSEAEKASNAGTLKSLMYYGTERGMNLQNLCCEANAANSPNLVITSYGTILSEFGQIASSGGDRGSHGGLFSLDYYRVILDEAHHVKNRQSKTAKACYEIAAKHRWVLTGTPIVNRLEDLFSLVHFLRVEPWSNFSFWKTFITVPFEAGDYMKALNVVQTVLEPLVLRRTKDMKTPDGEALVPLPPRTINIERVELSQDEREVYNLIFNRAQRTFSANVEAGTLMKSYTTIFAQILRLRQSCCHPVLTRNKTIVAEEEDAAAALDIANGLADDMDLQALIARFTADDDGEQDANKFGAHALKQIQEEAENECPICSEEPMIEQTVTGCWHSACKQCLLNYIDHQKDKHELPRCFNCREPINSRDVFEVVRHDDDIDDDSYIPNNTNSSKGDDDDDQQQSTSISHQPSSTAQSARITLRRLAGSNSQSAKISSLLSHLSTIRKTDPDAKTVVFSQFTSFLDLLEPVVSRARIPFLRFDGSMSQKQRAAVLSSFASDEDNENTSTMSFRKKANDGDISSAVTDGSTVVRPKAKGKVLLLSLRAGGVGLNLTAASKVFVMDPWWSWAVEAQAIDRVHRMGQMKNVDVTRFVCAESIEEKMLRIQERKKFIASSLGMMSDEEKKEQRMEDIRELLS
ncbi:MAG: DNA helicase rad5 [Alyxoria varia]|nr:MAG: DNA helicase rad5 [Alyxoria varia]